MLHLFVRALKGLDVHIAKLMEGHDELANYKAQIDAHGHLSDE